MSVSFTKRVSTGDYEFEEVTVTAEDGATAKQVAFDTLALKIKAKIEKAEQPPVASNEPEEKPKKRGRPKKAEAPKIEDPFEDEDNTPAALDEELDLALAKDAEPEKGPFDDDEDEDEILIRKATNREVRAALNRVAAEVSIDAANGILGEFKKTRVFDLQDPEENGAIVQAAEKLLKGK